VVRPPLNLKARRNKEDHVDGDTNALGYLEKQKCLDLWKYSPNCGGLQKLSENGTSSFTAQIEALSK
jgi:hypothetical protein